MPEIPRHLWNKIQQKKLTQGAVTGHVTINFQRITAMEKCIDEKREKCTMGDLARIAGVNQSTVSRWIKAFYEGECPKEISGVILMFEHSRRGFKDRLIQTIEDHSYMKQPGDWRAAAWLLEKCFPDEFGQKNVLKVENEGQAPVIQIFTGLDNSPEAQPGDVIDVENLARTPPPDESGGEDAQQYLEKVIYP